MSLLAILGVLSSAIYSGTSLLYATLGEVVGERSGIVMPAGVDIEIKIQGS